MLCQQNVPQLPTMAIATRSNPFNLTGEVGEGQSLANSLDEWNSHYLLIQASIASFALLAT